MYAKKGTTSATECADVVGFFFASLFRFINLFTNLRVFLVGSGNSSEFLSFFIEVCEEI